LMKETNKVKLAQLTQEFRDIKQAIAAAHGQVDNQAEENLKERLKKKEAEHQKIRIANEDKEGLHMEMLQNVIQIQEPDKYREKIKGFKEAFG
jgi:hypothetical protein